MGLSSRLAALAAPLVVLAVVVFGPGQESVGHAQSPTDLSGSWVLDRDNSQFPKEIGFGTIGSPFTGGDDNTASAPARGRRDGGGRSGSLQPSLRPGGESYDEGRRRQLLTDEVRTPPARLTIVDTPSTVTITDDKGGTRTFHPGAGAESLPLENVSVLTIASREDGKLTVLYSVADLRQIRYVFSRALGGGPLMVDVQLLERGNGEIIRRIYRPAPSTPSTTTSSTGTTNTPNGAAAPNGADNRTAGGVPAAGSGGPAVLPRAGSEYKGLTRIGLVVEELGPQAASCGVTREGLSTAVAKYFTDAGLKVTRDSDDDTYVYVRVMTSALGGSCVSRFDWTIYSMSDATLSYQRSPLLLQVELARRGGLVGGPAATHGNEVLQQMGSTLGPIATTIRDANK